MFFISGELAVSFLYPILFYYITFMRYVFLDMCVPDGLIVGKLDVCSWRKVAFI